MHNPLMALEFTASYVKDSLDVLRYYKHLAEGAIEQVPDEMLATAPDGESNSIATIVKHLSGNMQSRWKDFLTTDGEARAQSRRRVRAPLSGTRRNDGGVECRLVGAFRRSRGTH